MIYIFNFFLLFICSYVSPKNRNWVFILLSFYLIIFGALRADTIGIDTAGGYKDLWNWYSRGAKLKWLEPSWVFLMWLAQTLNLGYSGVIFISELLCILPTLYVIYKNRKYANIILMLFVYYGMFLYLYSFNIIRQSISMSFCFLSFWFYENKKKKRSFLFIVLAYFFHKSTLLFLISFVLIKLNYSFKKWIIILLITYILGNFLGKRFFMIVTGPYAKYLERSSYGFRNSSLLIKSLALLMNLFPISFIILSGRAKDIVRLNWCKMLLCGLTLMNITQSLILGTRLIIYFTQFQILFYPYIFQIKKKDKQIFLMTFFIYLLINFVKVLGGQNDSMTPYINILMQIY